MTYNLKYFRYNESSILIEWSTNIDENVLQDVLNFKNCIENKYIKQKVEIITAYSSLLIKYNFAIDNAYSEFEELKTLYKIKDSIQIAKSLIWNVPVCYDTKFGTDLEAFSRKNKLSIHEVIALHSDTIYTVYFIGFLPGFLYLGGLDKRLFLDRKRTPNLNVKKGSVAIGGQQTGIYPQDSPGGWHIIGNSPIELFNANQNPPCEIKAGDKVKFIPVDKQKYYKILNEVNTSNYQLKTINTNA